MDSLKSQFNQTLEEPHPPVNHDALKELKSLPDVLSLNFGLESKSSGRKNKSLNAQQLALMSLKDKAKRIIHDKPSTIVELYSATTGDCEETVPPPSPSPCADSESSLPEFSARAPPRLIAWIV